MASRRLVVELVGDSRSLDRALGRSQKNVGAFGMAAKRAGAAAAAILPAAAIKSTIDFDKSMRNVNSIAQLSEKRFKSLQTSVLRLAGPTAQAPNDLAKAMYDLVSSGFDANESLKIVEKSAKAASAGLTTAETSTKAVAAVLNAYKLSANDAGIVSDQLFRTVDRGVISFEELATQIGDVLPFAASLGVGLEQVGASVATMTKAGISSSETMTRIKAVMTTMLKPGTDLKAAFKELGVSSGEALIKQKGFQGALEALIGTTDGTKKAVAELFPNVRALGGTLALTGKNARGARKDLEDLRGASGSTSKAMSQQSKSVDHQWRKLKAQVTAVAIEIGVKLIPILTDAIDIALKVQRFISKAFRAIGRLLVEVWQDPKRAFGNFAASVLRGFAVIFDQASKLPVVGDKFDGVAAKTRRWAEQLDRIGEKTKKPLDVVVNFRIGEPVNLNDVFRGRFPQLVPPRDLPTRRGGGATSGLAMLSSGELAVEPTGRAWTVPGPRVAADNVMASVPHGTAIFTGHGQSLLAAGASMGEALARQLPHFATGGQVAGAAHRAGFRGSTLLRMVAEAKGESGWNERAVGDGGASKGLWQIHTGWNPWAARMNLFDPVQNARAAKRIYDSQGVGAWYADHTPHMAAAARAVRNMQVPGRRPGGRPGIPAYTRITRPRVTHPLLGNMLAPLVDDALMGGIQAGMERTGRRALLSAVLEGIVPESTDLPTRTRVPAVPGRPGRRPRRGGRPQFRPGGGWAGTKNLVMQAIRGIGSSRTFKRSVAINGNMDSDHNTWIKNAFAADMSPGSDAEFMTIARRLGIPARKGSWNSFTNKPLRGFRSQLLWHAPDGSHRDHIHLGIRRMRLGGIAGYRRGGYALTRRAARRGARQAMPLHGLAGRPGNVGADRLIRQYAGVVRDRTPAELLADQRRIRRLIRGMAKKGFTGQERIRTRRLRGALTLVQDELGRDIGGPLGASDRTQDAISRREGRFDADLAIAGIDPDSAEGIAAQRALAESSIGALTVRRRKLSRSLRIAKKSGNRAAVRQVQAEINEVDDQIHGYRGQLALLERATADNTDALQAQTDAINAQAEAMRALQEELKRQNDFASSVVAISGREAVRALADVISGQLGGIAHQRSLTPGVGALTAY